MSSLTKKVLWGAGMFVAGRYIYNTVRDAVRLRSFRESVVVISGGSRGLGLLMAQEFAREGASLALLARDEAELRRARNIIHSEFPHTIVQIYVCDCTKADQVKRTIAQVYSAFKQIDVVVNNAGVISSMPISNATGAEYEESLATHFWGPYNVIQNCRPFLEAGARIVNISSIGGKIPIPHLAPYCTGKFALVGYSETLRAEMMEHGIYVTTVCPGLMRTGSVDHAMFKGQFQKEYAWFSIINSMPYISADAARSAKAIVEATRIGKAELRLSMPTKLAVLAQTHFPEFFHDALAFANAFLPAPTQDEHTKVEGFDAHSEFAPSRWTRGNDEAARRNNETERSQKETDHGTPEFG